MSQNGLPSKSKKRSPGEGSGRSEKPLSGCGCEEPEGVRAGLARAELELGLLAELRPGVGGIPAGAGSARRAPELRERRDPGGGELLDLRPVEPGDAGEVVDRVPVRVAERLEVADRAVVDRVRLGRRRVGDEALEPRADAPVVGGELLRAGTSLLAVSRAGRGSCSGSRPWMRASCSL